MRKGKKLAFSVAIVCLLALFVSFIAPLTPAIFAEGQNRVTASTSSTIKQGNTGYCYAYIDSLESLSSLEVAVHFDPDKISVTGSYNQVAAEIYDSSVTDSCVQYSYIFDGNGEKAQTQLFYFQYQVAPDAEVGQTYFDILVSEAYDKDLNVVSVSGSRCNFEIQQKSESINTYIYGTNAVSTSVNEEFTVSYNLGTTQVASGAFALRYDPELFELVALTTGDFFTNKIVDTNTSLSGAAYVSFFGGSYGNSTQLITARFRTRKNVTETSQIKLVVTEFYNLTLDSVACSGYTTAVGINKDPTYDENAPVVTMNSSYDEGSRKLTVTVTLPADSHLGAGDFLMRFDPERLGYVSAEKGFEPTYFGINDKAAGEGTLRFSVINLSDIITEETLVTVTFDGLKPCEDTPVVLSLKGGALADSLTETIVLNFTDLPVTLPGHTVIVDEAVAPDCLNTGLTEGSHCDVCEKVLVAQETVAALGHDEIPHDAQAQTCTEIGWGAYVTCSRCDYTTYAEIPADGHRHEHSICTVCGDKQAAAKSWDISKAADGSLMAYLYQNHTGGYDLHILGEGAMKDWGYASATPWYSYRYNILKLELDEGLTTIGSHAFYGFSSLDSLTIGENITAIGNYAFYECSNVTQIQFLAKEMADMGNNSYAFYGCGQNASGITVTFGAEVIRIPGYLFDTCNSSNRNPKITALSFPENSACTTIGSYAFAYNPYLTSLNLPDSVTTIEEYAFHNCAISGEVVLPAALETVGRDAFSYCYNITVLEIPEGVKSLGYNAFYDVRGLEQLRFNAVSMDSRQDQYVFSYAGKDSGGFDVTFGAAVEHVPQWLFYGNVNVTTVAFEEGSRCTTIGDYAFCDAYTLHTVTLPETLEQIGAYAFAGTNIQTILVPGSVHTIGYYAFGNCSELVLGFSGADLPENLGDSWCDGSPYYTNVEKFVLTEDATYVFDDRDGVTFARYRGDAATFTIPQTLEDRTVDKVGDYAFYNRRNLIGVEFPDTLTHIGKAAFSYCSALETITLPENLRVLGESAFYECGNVTAIYLDAVCLADLTRTNGTFYNCGTNTEGITVYVGAGVRRIPGNLFMSAYSDNAKITWVEFAPDGICEEIGSDAFCYTQYLPYILLPETINKLGNNVFYGADRLIVAFAGELPEEQGGNWNSSGMVYTQVRDVVRREDALYVLTKADTAILAYYEGAADTVVIPDAVDGYPVTEVGNSAFKSNSAVTCVTLPDSVTRIGSYAFYYCTALATVNMPRSLTSVGEYGFYNCYQLAVVEFGSNLTTIGAYAFNNCAKLERLTIGKGVSTIGEYAFYNCTALTQIDFRAENMADLGSGNYVFAYAGQNGTGITVTIGAEVTRIPAYLMYPYGGSSYYPYVTELAFEEGSRCTEIGSYAFCGCDDMTRMTIPESVTSLGNFAFYNCPALEEIDFRAENMADLGSGNYVFAYAGQSGTGLTVTIGREVTRIPAYLMYPYGSSSYYPNVTELAFEEGSRCTEIGVYAFSCTSITELTIPDSVTKIGGHAFSGTPITELTIPDSVTTIAGYAFGYCKNLKRLEIGKGVREIWNSAFYNCPALEEIDFRAENMEDLESQNYIFSFAGQSGAGITVRIGPEVTRIPNFLFYPYASSSYYPYVTELVFAEGSRCTEIGSYAFYNCDDLTKVTIPGSVTTIGEYAFAYCAALQSAGFSDSVTTIGARAFTNCTALTKLEGLGSLQTIGEAAFSSCKALTKLEGLNSLQTIGVSGFDSCTALKQVVLPESLQTIGNYAFYCCTALETVDIHEGVTTIGSSAFSGCTGLEKLDIPEGVTTIGGSAFSGCTGLKTLTIPSTVTSLGSYAFYNCTALTAINYNPTALADLGYNNYVFGYCGTAGEGITFTVGANVTHIPAYLCKPYRYGGYEPKLVNLVFAEGSLCTTIGQEAFYNCYYLEQVDFNAVDMEDISSNSFYNAGAKGSGIHLTVGAEVTRIPANLTGYWNLTQVTFAEGSACREIGSYAFYEQTNVAAFAIPETVEVYGEYAFYNCSGVTKIHLGENVTHVGTCAFYSCKNVTEVYFGTCALGNSNSGLFSECGSAETGYTLTIGAGVTAIPDSMFSGTYVTKVTFESGSQCTRIGQYAFNYCTLLEQVVWPQSLEVLGYCAFYGCEKLKSIHIPATVTTIGNYAFYNCRAVTEIRYDAANVEDFSYDNFVFCYCGQDGEGITVTIGNTVERLPNYVFAPNDSTGYAPKITSVTFEEGSRCTQIGVGAFRYNSYLPQIELPRSLEVIGSSAFYYCSALTAMDIHEGVTTIGSSAFSGCTGLEELDIPEGVTTIGSSAFSGCTGLKTLTIPSTVTGLGNYAFNNCTALTAINYNPTALADLTQNNYVFAYCGTAGEGITFTVGANVTHIPAYLCKPYRYSSYEMKIVKLIIEAGDLASIGQEAFGNCYYLERLEWNAKNTGDLSSNAFSNVGKNSQGVTVIVGENVERIPAYLCYSYDPAEVRFAEGSLCTQVGNYAFYDCSGTKFSGLPQGLTAVGDYAFYNCQSIDVSISTKNLTSIGEYAFYNCNGITEIYLAEGVSKLGNYAFANCKNVTEFYCYTPLMSGMSSSVFSGCGTAETGYTLTIGAGVTAIPNSMFSGTYVTKVTFESGSQCTGIGRYAFNNCTLLEQVVWPQSLQNIGYCAFYGCEKLKSIHIPATVTTIGEYAFYNCTAVTEIRYDAANAADFSSDNRVFAYCGQNTDGVTVTIGNTVERLPAYVFSPYDSTDYAPKITVVTFAEDSSCIEIGYSAFKYCNSLTRINLPQGLEIIGSYAFYSCSSLTAANIPDTVTAIGSYAFAYGSAMTEITIPAALTSLGNGAFDECRWLTKINYNAVALADLAEANEILNHAGQNGEGITFVVGKDVTHIPAYLGKPYYYDHYCPKIKTLIFAPGGACKTIGQYAFYNCAYLERVEFGAVAMDDLSTKWMTNSGSSAGGITLVVDASVTRIPANFTRNWNLTQVTFAEGSRCTEIGSYAFYGHSGVAELVLPESLTTIGDYAFYYCTGLRTLSLQNAVRVGANAFYYCTNLETVEFGQNLTSIGSYAFCNCSGLKALVLPDSLTDIGNSAFSGCTGLVSVKLSNALQTISNYTFYNCTSLTELVLPQGLQTIGESAFRYCQSLQKICIPASVTSVGSYAFDNCASLKLVEIRSEAAVNTISGNYLGNNRTTVLIPASCGSNNYLQQNYGTPVAVVYDGLDFLRYSKCNHDWQMAEVLQEKIQCQQDGWTRFQCANCATCEDRMTDRHDMVAYAAKAVTCTDIGWDAYEACDYCDLSTYVEISALGHDEVAVDAKAPTCLDVGWQAHVNCSRCDYTTYVEIPALGHDEVHHDAKAPNCTDIGWGDYVTCTRCDYTTYQEIPANGHRFRMTACQVCGVAQEPYRSWDVSANGDGSVMAYAYANHDGTNHLEITGSGKMKDYDFGTNPWCYSYSFATLTIEDGVTELGRLLFYSTGLPNIITIPDSVDRIGDYAFYGADGIVIFEGTAPEELSYNWDYDVCGFTAPRKVVETDDAIYVVDAEGVVWLAKCKTNKATFEMLEEVDGVPVSAIAKYAFNSVNVRYFAIPESITKIEGSAFNSCKYLVLSVATEEVPSFVSAYVDSSVPVYGAPQKVILDDSGTYVLTRDGEMIYAKGANRSGLEILAEMDGYPVRRIEKYAFYSNFSIYSVVIPEGITHLSEYAFSNCYYLQRVTLPDSLVSIGSYAFYWDYSIQELKLPEGLQSIGGEAFYYCYGMKEMRIPETVTTLGNNSLGSCTGLTLVEVRSPEAAAKLANSGLPASVTTVIVPAGTACYLADIYGAGELTQVDGVAYEIYSICDHSWYRETIVSYVPCITDGLDRETCTLCGAVKETVQDRHQRIHHPAQAPTCSEEGWDDYDTCGRCEFTTLNVLPALGHRVYRYDSIWVESYTTKNDMAYPFLLKDGVYSSTNKSDYGVAVFTVNAQYACALEITYKVSSENGCDWLIIAHNGVQLDAISGEVDWKSLTLTLKAGDEVTITYRKDGSVASGSDTGWFTLSAPQAEVVERVEVPAESMEPTCTDDVVCDICGSVVKSAEGHDLIWHEPKEAGCTEIGWEWYYTCAKCDYSTYEEIPALGHDYAHVPFPPTCLEGGYIAHWCMRCGEAYADEEVPPVDHDYQEGVCSYCGLVNDLVLAEAEILQGGVVIAGYNTFSNAVRGLNGLENALIRLRQDVQTDAWVDGNLWIDLNGHSLRGVTVTGTVYGMDSATDGYTAASVGTLVLNRGTVSTDAKTSAANLGSVKRYLAVQENGVWSFHRFYFGITHMTLQPESAGIGYRAAFAGDSKVRENLDSFGLQITLDETFAVYSAASFRKELFAEEGMAVSRSVLLRNVLILMEMTDEEGNPLGINWEAVAERANMPVYARSFLKTADGTVITSTVVKTTLRELVEQVDALYPACTAAQKGGLQRFYQRFEPVFSGWNLPNLASKKEQLF